MSRRVLVQGQVYQLDAPRPIPVAAQVPRPLRPASAAGPSTGMAWRLAGTALLGLVAAGIVAVLGYGGSREGRGPGPVTVASPAPKSAASRSKPAEPPPAPVPAAPAPAAPAPAAPAARAPAPPPPSPVQASPPLPPWSASTPGSASLVTAPVVPPVAIAPVLPGPAASPGPAPISAGAPSTGEEAKAAARADQTATRVPTAPGAPTECLPEGLKSVLVDLQAKFGTVTVVSTTHLHTDNHSKGSVRDKMHQACKAVDFKVLGDAKAVLAYLKTRREVAGIGHYRNNGVIHIDASGAASAAVDGGAKPAAKTQAKAVRPKPRGTARKSSAASTEAEPAAE